MLLQLCCWHGLTWVLVQISMVPMSLCWGQAYGVYCIVYNVGGIQEYGLLNSLGSYGN